jgi:probable non-F420 flavinoid oxidoreductase
MSEPRIGFHCSHEQHAPSTLLQLAVRAESAGFDAAMCSDHLNPWSERQGASGYTWSWLGAAMQSTRGTWGTVCAPGQRYHPAIVAQAAATLAEMYPGRFWLAVGSGEALNEAVTGDRWPAKPERQLRLRECVDVMRALWAGETVTHHGRVHVQNARLYTRPGAAPLVIGAAITPETARWMGGWADGLITVTAGRDRMRAVVDAFREGGGDGKPMFLQAVVAFGRSDEESAVIAHDQWRQCALDPSQLADFDSVAAFDAATADITVDDVAARVRASADVRRHVEWLRSDLDLGFTRVYVHNLVRDHDRFFEVWGEQVLPSLLAAVGA